MNFESFFNHFFLILYRFKKVSKRVVISAFLFFVMVCTLNGCTGGSSQPMQVSDTGFFLDTVVTITLNGTNDTGLIDQSFSLLSDYENMLSRTVKGSDIWKINHSSGNPVQVSDETAKLIRTALAYCDLSDGAFDITIAPVISLWDFKGEGEHSLPDRKTLKNALTHVDYRAVQVEGNQVTLTDPEASIDLGAIAKGYIADRLKEFLVNKGITSGLINLGGNNLAIGTKPGNTPWKIGVRKPFGDSSELCDTVDVNGTSVVTSGTYERCFRLNGKLYHHILDPKTGYPVDNGLTSVTILSESSLEGDALSTTCFCLGLEKAMELVESLDGVEALFITEDSEIHGSSGF